MICPNCGMELEENEQVCSLCGYEFNDNTVSDVQETAIETETINEPIKKQAVSVNAKPKKNTMMVVIIVILFILVIGLAAFVILLAMDKNSDSVNNTVSVSETTEALQSDTVESVSDTEISEETTETTSATEATTEVVTEPTGEDYSLAYGWRLEEADMYNPGPSYRVYTLFDIDSNGIYELIMKTGDSEAVAKFTIWTIVGNTVTYCGELGGSHSYFSQMDGKLYVNCTHMGYQRTEEVTLVDNKISKSVYYDSAEAGEPMLVEYYSFGDPVNMLDFSDPALLKQYSDVTHEKGYYTSENFY